MYDYSDSYAWQNESLDILKANAGMKEEAAAYSNAASFQYVVVLGYPQTGKTEILLRLLEIDDGHLADVYRVLRADQTTGASSTSTAIMYHRSERNLWGIKKEYIDAKNNSAVREYAEKDILSKLTYCEEDEFIKKLKDIRIQIENNSTSFLENKILLHLYIPKQFFKSISEDSINVIDFPGTESSNKKEAAYVRRLARHFLPLAKKILLICNAAGLRDLRTIEITGLEELVWTDEPYRYIVIPTRIYTSMLEKCIKAYCEDAQAFPQQCIDICINDVYTTIKIEKSLESQIQIHPLEVGESLAGLKTKPLWQTANMPDDFYAKMREANDKQLEAIRTELFAKGTEQPLTERITIKKLLEERYGKIIQSKEKEEGDISKSLQKLKKDESTLSEDVAKADGDYKVVWKEFNEHKKNYENVMAEGTQTNIRLKDEFENWLCNHVSSVSDYDDMKMQSKLLNDINYYADSLRVTYSNATIYDTGIVDNSFQQFSVYITADDRASIKNFFERDWGFLWLSRLDKDDVCERISDIFCGRLDEWHINGLRKPFETAFSKWSEKMQSELNDRKSSFNILDTALRNCKANIKKKSAKLNSLSEEVNEARTSQEEATKIFENWQDVARVCFTKQKNVLSYEINNTKNAALRVYIFLVICKITSDYEKLIKGDAQYA